MVFDTLWVTHNPICGLSNPKVNTQVYDIETGIVTTPKEYFKSK